MLGGKTTRLAHESGGGGEETHGEAELWQSCVVVVVALGVARGGGARRLSGNERVWLWHGGVGTGVGYDGLTE